MIKISGLTKRFGRLHVLQGLDLEIERGCVTAIVGPNGAGKTTLIKSILGLTQADGGKILVNGERVARDDSRYREAIGYMPQIARFPENLTAADLIAMLRDLRGDDATIDEDLIERFNLEPHLRKPLRALSGGTRQKVNAVMAFLFSPQLLILDEPTSGLDPVSSGVLKDKILETRSEGRTVIVSSHVMSELDELADRVVILLEGRTKYTGSVHDLKLDTRQLSLERAVAELMLREVAA
jgi:Cu-processing system ATP-binding protein